MLVETGFCGTKVRETNLARFLVRNEITKLGHLQFADHPSGWPGAEAFSAEELDAVWAMKNAGRKRSRHVQHRFCILSNSCR